MINLSFTENELEELIRSDVTIRKKVVALATMQSGNQGGVVFRGYLYNQEQVERLLANDPNYNKIATIKLARDMKIPPGEERSLIGLKDAKDFVELIIIPMTRTNNSPSSLQRNY